MSPNPDADLGRLRAICLAQPSAAEKISYGVTAFFIAKGRIFAWFLHDHHGKGITAIAVKTSGPEEQAMLVEADPDLFYRPPYLAPRGWIGIRLDVDGTDWSQIEARIEQSWALVAPTRLREQSGR